MQEALQRHFVGIDFIERNAGPDIDEHMQEEGERVETLFFKNLMEYDFNLESLSKTTIAIENSVCG
ncbi:unnamed protein product [Gongylonema pulchrum]|uniref:Glycosyltransferase n=1 Tax=Gongylonema pulchrum TaxID=637853 RepID=A0A183EIT2_9BILA|nr:unnamed protein product [Gongylonema pulchrum]